LVSPRFRFGVIDLFNDAAQCCTGYKNPYMVIVVGFNDTGICIDWLDAGTWYQTSSPISINSLDIRGLFIIILAIV
jgi:hypothetical protein